MFSVATKAMKRLFRSGGRKRERSEYRQLRSEPLEPRQLLANTVGTLVSEPGAFEGYTLFAPSTEHNTYLIDMDGQVVNQWESDFSPMSTYLMEDGDLIRAANVGERIPQYLNAAGISGRIERFDWDGDLEWRYTLNGPNRQIHHDFEVMPNGNILMIAWERKTKNQAIRAGRDLSLYEGNHPPDSVANVTDNSYIWPDMIIEVQPYANKFGGKIVWEWHLWDHLVQQHNENQPANYYGDNGVAEHPELVDINFESGKDRGGTGVPQDWTHFNGVDYNAELDQVSISVREFSELWIVDHDMDYDQYAQDGKKQRSGSDLLYRWGNPRTYGVPGGQEMYYQHDADWIPEGYPGEGNMTVFDNGSADRPNSRAIELVLPWNEAEQKYDLTLGQEYGPADPFWSYAAKPGQTEFYSLIISSVQRQPDGTTLIDQGSQGRIFEVTTDGEIVWDYVNPISFGRPTHQGDGVGPVLFVDATPNLVFRSFRYAPDFAGFVGKDLTPSNFLEINPGDSAGLYDRTTATWYLNNRSDGKISDMTVVHGPAVPRRLRPVAGDWDGDGDDTIGLYDPSLKVFYLNNETDDSVGTVFTVNVPNAPAGSVPLAGDWNDDGVDTIGLYDPNARQWHLKEHDDQGNVTGSNVFKGLNVGAQWIPIVGDWDGDGTDSWGMYRKGANVWHMFSLNGVTRGTRITVRGPAVPTGWRPITGDWNSNGVDTIGLYDKATNTWHLNNKTDGTISDLYSFSGPATHPTWLPITGNWDGSTSTITQPEDLRLDAVRLAGLGAAATLTEGRLSPVFDAAVARVSAAEGSLGNVSVAIVDLPGDLLGQVIKGSRILIDVDAAGAGWYTGAKPGGDGVDLLTAVMHELGHTLGKTHADGGVMGDTLRPGVRHDWDSDVDAVFAA